MCVRMDFLLIIPCFAFAVLNKKFKALIDDSGCPHKVQKP